MSTTALPFDSAEAVVEIPLERITESARNPRQTFSEETLQELADSIATQGVLQPIVVRQLERSIFGFEIVFGHRRFRASVKARRETIPAIVRLMSDEQADQARLHENLEREDVHYVEEAEAMQRLMTDHGVTAAQLAEQTGKKLTYVYGRLKLANLHPKVREACLAKTFTAEVATLIARWPLAVQPRAMEVCLEMADMFDEKKGKVSRSYRHCRQALRNLAIPIARAEFDPADTTLLRPDGHPGACVGCPNNTASDPELAEHFEDAKCLHRECFDAKEGGAEQRKIEAARAEGRVGSINDPRSADDLSGHNWMGRGTVVDILRDAEKKGLAVPKPKLLLDDDGELRAQVYDRKAVRELQALMFPDTSPAATSGAGDEDDDNEEHWIDGLHPDQRAVVDHEGWHNRVLPAILAAARRAPRTAEELREVLLEMLVISDQFHSLAEQAMGWPSNLDEADDPQDEREALLRDMEPADLASLLVLDSLCERTNVMIGAGSDPDRAQRHISMRLELAHRYGVDVVKAAEPTPPPAPAASEVRTSENAAPAATKGGGVRYRNPSTGETWTGKGLQPKWLKAALAAGRSLADFDTTAGQSSQTMPAGAGGSAAEVAA